MVIFLIEHIVRINEKTEDILSAYHITLDELKENNLHITDFKRLPSGVKLHIPYLNQETEQILESTEGFVMNYYPKVEEIEAIEDDSSASVKGEDISPSAGIISNESSNNRSSFRNNINAYPGITLPRKPYMGNRNR